MKDEEHAQDDEPERGEERSRPIGSSQFRRVAVLFAFLIQVATLAGEISDLFR